MDEEQPRLRKRSEVSRARRDAASAQQAMPVAALPKEEPPKEQANDSKFDPKLELAMREGADENISAFVEVLNALLDEAKLRVRVSLVVAAGWGVDKRREVRAWMLAPKFPPPEVILSSVAKEAPPRAKEEAPKSPPKAAAKQEEPVFDHAGLKRRLSKEAGVDVPVVDVEAWRQMARDVVITWLDQGARKSEKPEILEKYASNVSDESKTLRKGERKPTFRERFERTPDGHINNCALANGEEEKDCQICEGACPDRTKYAGARKLTRSEPEEFGLSSPKTVAQASEALKEEIAKTEHPKSGRPEREEKPPERPASESDDYNRLIESVLREVDLGAEYDELERNLEVGAERTQYGVIYEALDKAEGRARRAFSLAANAKIEHERVRLDQKEVDAELHRRAMEKLREDGDKTRIADVEAKIAELFPDEWRSGKMRVKRSEVSVEMCQKLGELWTQKVRSLQVMLSNVRR
jgi:hypothetical protein